MANATWLADVLRTAGVPVIEEAGWQSRAQSGSFAPRGLIRHWDASSPGSHGAVDYMRDNIACNIVTCRGNSAHGPTVHVLAAGRAWHAGEGQFGAAFPKDQGNTYALGHEIAHTVDEPWGAGQMDVVVAAEQAILAHLDSDVDTEWCTHSEYAPTRKIDTTEGDHGQDPAAERARLSGTTPPGPGPGPGSTEWNDDMPMMFRDVRNDSIWLLFGNSLSYIGDSGFVKNLQTAGVPAPVAVTGLDFDRMKAVAHDTTDPDSQG